MLWIQSSLVLLIINTLPFSLASLSIPFHLEYNILRVSLVAQMVTSMPAMQETQI